MNKPGPALLPLAILFLFISVLIFLLSSKLEQLGFNTAVLHAGNILFFLLSILSFFIQLRGIRHANPHVFIRSVMMGMMMKMAVCLVTVFAYVYYAGSSYNKRSVFAALFLYLIYLSAEVIVVMKMNKKKNA